MTRILVIEDEAPILENIAETLEIEGFDVYTAPNGETGVNIAVRERPDLILCDILMPGMDGYGVLAEIRNTRPIANTPFIFLTALAARSAHRQGMEMGADDYLSKPFTPTELLRAIQSRLDKHQKVIEEQKEKLDDLRSRIIYALPHEFRTPMAGLIGCVDIIMMDHENISREELYSMAEVMQRSVLRLQRVTENYLLYAQLEVHRNDTDHLLALRSESVEYPDAIIHEAALQLAQQEGREGDISVNLQPARIAVGHDNFRKIVYEILENAFKFSKASTNVTVESYLDENNVYTVVVSDQGRGMSQDDIDSIGAYMQFERLLYEQQGLGLGLAIAKRLVEIHNGCLKIDSMINQGTQVYIQLPLA